MGEFLSLVMFVYRTSVRTTTGASPFDLMFGCSTHTPPLPAYHAPAHDASSHPEQLRCKLLKTPRFYGNSYDRRDKSPATIIQPPCTAKKF